MENNIIHIFEEAKLGKAPFKFIGIEEKIYKPHPDAPARPGGSCQYCGHSIIECCHIRSSDGKEFIVGNECVKKTGEAGLISLTKKAINEVLRKKREKADWDFINTNKYLLDDGIVRNELIKHPRPHPNYELSLKGYTLLNWAYWMMDHAGRTGKKKVLKKLIEIKNSVAKVSA